mmetsp:Transcript_47690/g.137741  ORF Transcript_47690/g.137741 Transcript_47690/m.137741 type:complete len:1244 (+) Transcript_47690:38-3769(+)
MGIMRGFPHCGCGQQQQARSAGTAACMFLLATCAIGEDLSLWRVTAGHCQVINATCVTSTNYPHDYPNNDDCTVTAQKAGQVIIDDFSTEHCCDHLSVSGRRVEGSTGFDVKQGATLSWSSDYSNVGRGWKVCLDPSAQKPTWDVTSGDCSVDGDCVSSSNFPNNYPDNSHCEFHSNKDGLVRVEAFHTESCCDHLSLGSFETYQGTMGPSNLYLEHTDNFIWHSDYSNTDSGWKLCLTPQTTLPVLRQLGGNCEIQGDCIQSQGFGSHPYAKDSNCAVEIRKSGVLNAVYFQTRQSPGGLMPRLPWGKCLQGRGVSEELHMKNCTADTHMAFAFNSRMELMLPFDDECANAEGPGDPIMMVQCGAASEWHFDGELLKVKDDDSLCLTAYNPAVDEGPGYATMEPCTGDDRQRWLFIGQEKTGEVLSVGKSEFSGDRGPLDMDLAAGTVLKFEDSSRRRRNVPGEVPDMKPVGWKVCLRPRSVLPEFLLVVAGLQVLIWISLYGYHVYWTRSSAHHEAESKVGLKAEDFSTSLLRHFMPSKAINNYRFRGMRAKDATVSLKFQDLGLNLKDGRCVLNGVTGEFNAGRLVGILGPSGAGKTTFMNVLCGKATYGTMKGTVFVNNADCDVRVISSVMGFVPQDDVVHEKLTVRENLSFAALLRNPPNTSHARVTAIVEDVLNVMQMGHIQRSIVGGVEERGISGGQRKRVNIGLELAGCPTLLFLDEPTSGLDSTSSLAIINSLKKMTQLNMTIIMVIHQPRYSLFTLFDDVLLLGVGGHTVYLGPSLSAASYFQGLGFQLPASENPADWFMDIISGEVANQKDPHFKPQMLFKLWPEKKSTVIQQAARALTEADDHAILKKGLEDQWDIVDKDHSGTLDEKELRELLTQCSGEEPEEAVLNSLLKRMAGTSASSQRFVSKAAFMEFIDGLLEVTASDQAAETPSTDLLAPLLSIRGDDGPLAGLKRKRPGFGKQFVYITRRRLVQTFRNNRRRFIDSGLVISCALIAGSMHNGKLGVDGTTLPQSLMICHLGLSLLTTVSSVKVFGADRPVFWRESASGTSVAAFFYARITVDTLELLLQCVLYSAVYYEVAQPWHPSMSFALYFWPCLLVSLTSAGWGYLISTLVPPENAVLGAVIFALVFCGIFGDPTNIGNFISGKVGDCVTLLSITRWSVQMTFSQTLERAADMKMEVSGPLLLLDQDYKKGVLFGYGWDTAVKVLLGQVIALRCFGFLGLKYRNRDKQI